MVGVEPSAFRRRPGETLDEAWHRVGGRPKSRRGILRKLVEDHHRWTGSARAKILDHHGMSERASSSRCSRTNTSARRRNRLRENGRHGDDPQSGRPRRGLAVQSEPMGKITGSWKIQRVEDLRRRSHAPEGRLRSSSSAARTKAKRVQSARCMDCGTPFCKPAAARSTTSSRLQRPRLPRRLENRAEPAAQHQQLPRVHRRICPAPREAACTSTSTRRGRHQAIEHAIIDRGWEKGWVVPQPPGRRPAARSRVVGSGPAGPGAAATGRAPATRDGVRKNDRVGRPAALRHPGLQDGEARSTAASRRCRPRA